MNEILRVPPLVHDENDIIDLVHQIGRPNNSIKIHLQMGLYSVEHVFNRSIAGPVWCPKFDMVTCVLNQTQYHWMFVDIQVVHSESVALPGTMNTQPID